MQSDNQSWICCGRVESQEIQHKEAKAEGEWDGPLTCIRKQSCVVSISPVSGQDSSALDVSGEGHCEESTTHIHKKQWLILSSRTGEHGPDYSHCNWVPQGMERKLGGSLILTFCPRFNWNLIRYLPTEHHISNNSALCTLWHIKTSKESTQVYMVQG